MRRLSVYISLLLLSLLLLNGSRVERAVDTYGGQQVPYDTSAKVASLGHTAANAYLDESYTWFLNPAARSEAAAGRTVPVWLTGVRRILSSPSFITSDASLNYHRAESAARSFASWRTSLCGSSGGGAISVLRPGDSYVYALCRIVV